LSNHPTNHPTAILASGAVNLSDEIIVQLIEPAREPSRIVIVWPPHSSVTTPGKFDQTAAAAMRVLSSAVVELAALRVHRRL
jgi:hypothetical protein